MRTKAYFFERNIVPVFDTQFRQIAFAPLVKGPRAYRMPSAILSYGQAAVRLCGKMTANMGRNFRLPNGRFSIFHIGLRNRVLEVR